MSTPDPFSKSTLFERALKRILRPLVRSLIAQGVMAPALYKIIKQSYVDVAAKELGGTSTDSRISIMTGVHRRDVKALRSETSPVDTENGARISLLATVVGQWLSDVDLQAADGGPIPLPRTAQDGPSFDGLVERINRDVRPRTILDELQRQGLVRQENGLISLDAKALVGPADLDQKVHFFSYNVGDHVNAAVDNLLNDPSPFMERAVFYNYLTRASVDDIETDARQLGNELLQQINAKAAGLQNTDKSDANATERFRLGVFFYREDEAIRDTNKDI